MALRVNHGMALRVNHGMALPAVAALARTLSPVLAYRHRYWLTGTGKTPSTELLTERGGRDGLVCVCLCARACVRLCVRAVDELQR